MNIERIEHGPEKKGLWSRIAFTLMIALTLVAAGITGAILWKILFSEPSEASTRPFMETIGTLLASLIFVLGAMIYLYVKGILQDEYVTTVE